jgi:outer membrane protein TolC
MQTPTTRRRRPVATADATASRRGMGAGFGGFALAALLVAPGCTQLRQSAALDPMRQAPATASETYVPPAAPEVYRASPESWRLAATVVPEPGKVHDLAALSDLALRAHPTTRRTWEEARGAAARLGRAESAYYPRVDLEAGATRYKDWAPTTTGTESKHVTEGGGALALTWTLLDFGRRSADTERARQALLAANFSFNRSLQDVVFGVQRSYFALDAKRALVRASEADLEAAINVAAAAEARLSTGLATRPDALLALQEKAAASYAVEDARGRAASAQADLAVAVGVPASAPLEIETLDRLPLPDALREDVEQLIDAALARRPDLAADLASIRAQEAQLARERARFLPKVSLEASARQVGLRYSVGAPVIGYESHVDDRLLYGAYLRIEWSIFEGFDRVNAVREAKAGVEARRAALAERELRAMSDVWKAYADLKAAFRKYDFGIALLEASQDAYDATLESYRVGLGDVTNLLLAYRDLSRARATLIDTKAELLTASAALAYAGGAMSVGSLGP